MQQKSEFRTPNILPERLYYGGIDIGTSSTKVLILDETGAPCILTSRSYPLERPHPGYAEQDPEAILEAVIEALREALTRIGPRALAALGFSSAMHSVVLLDEALNPFTPVITWADARSEAEASQLRRTAVGQDIFRKTGTPIHPMAPLSKLIWMQNQRPGWLAHAHKIVSIKEYVLFGLFGLNVLLGKASVQLGWDLPLLGDVAEFLLLLLATAVLTLAGLRRESDTGDDNP